MAGVKRRYLLAVTIVATLMFIRLNEMVIAANEEKTSLRITRTSIVVHNHKEINPSKSIKVQDSEVEKSIKSPSCLEGTLLAHKLVSVEQLPASLPINLLCNWTTMATYKDHRMPKPAEMAFGNYFWQVLKSSKKETIFMYNAYYDDRDIANVRVLALVDKFNDVDTSLKCLLWHKNKAMEVEAEVATLRRELSYNRTFANYPLLISCKSPALPLAVSLLETGSEREVVSNVLGLVDNRPNKPEKETLAVCVKPYWVEGKEHTQRMAEWFELQFILGAEKVFISPFVIDSYCESLLQYYQGLGKAEKLQPFSLSSVQRMTLAQQDPSTHRNELIRTFHEDIVLSDCVLRNIHRFKYLALLDTDEVIMPVHASNLTSLLSSLEAERLWQNQSIPTDFNFKAFYFLDGMTNPAKLAGPPHKHMLRHVRRGPILRGQKYQGKPIVRTAHTVTVWSHCSTLCLTGNCTQLWVPATRAKLAHYRKGCRLETMPEGYCRALHKAAKADTSISRFAARLKRNTKATLEKLGMYE